MIAGNEMHDDEPPAHPSRDFWLGVALASAFWLLLMSNRGCL